MEKYTKPTIKAIEIVSHPILASSNSGYIPDRPDRPEDKPDDRPDKPFPLDDWHHKGPMDEPW